VPSRRREAGLPAQLVRSLLTDAKKFGDVDRRRSFRRVKRTPKDPTPLGRRLLLKFSR
jgi:hypothetical protein